MSIVKIRSTENALKNGEIKFLKLPNEILGYERLYNNEKIIVVVNTIEMEENIFLSEINSNKNIIDLINSDKKYEIKDGKLKLNLKGHEYKILKVL